MRLLVFNYDNYVYYKRNYITSVTAGRIKRLLHQLAYLYEESYYDLAREQAPSEVGKKISERVGAFSASESEVGKKLRRARRGVFGERVAVTTLRLACHI